MEGIRVKASLSLDISRNGCEKYRRCLFWTKCTSTKRAFWPWALSSWFWLRFGFIAKDTPWRGLSHHSDSLSAPIRFQIGLIVPIVLPIRDVVRTNQSGTDTFLVRHHVELIILLLHLQKGFLRR